MALLIHGGQRMRAGHRGDREGGAPGGAAVAQPSAFFPQSDTPSPMALESQHGAQAGRVGQKLAPGIPAQAIGERRNWGARKLGLGGIPGAGNWSGREFQSQAIGL